MASAEELRDIIQRPVTEAFGGISGKEAAMAALGIFSKDEYQAEKAVGAEIKKLAKKYVSVLQAITGIKKGWDIQATPTSLGIDNEDAGIIIDISWKGNAITKKVDVVVDIARREGPERPGAKWRNKIHIVRDIAPTPANLSPRNIIADRTVKTFLKENAEGILTALFEDEGWELCEAVEVIDKPAGQPKYKARMIIHPMDQKEYGGGGGAKGWERRGKKKEIEAQMRDESNDIQELRSLIEYKGTPYGKSHGSREADLWGSKHGEKKYVGSKRRSGHSKQAKKMARKGERQAAKKEIQARLRGEDADLDDLGRYLEILGEELEEAMAAGQTTEPVQPVVPMQMANLKIIQQTADQLSRFTKEFAAYLKGAMRAKQVDVARLGQFGRQVDAAHRIFRDTYRKLALGYREDIGWDDGGDLAEASMALGFRVTTPDIGPTTQTSEIISGVQKALKGRSAVKLGRWLMVPPGRVFKLPEKYRSTAKIPPDADEYEVALYGADKFVKAWLKDW